jgi:hypothetical protein
MSLSALMSCASSSLDVAGINVLDVGKPFVSGIDHEAVAFGAGAVTTFFHELVCGLFAEECDVVVGEEL